MEAVIETTKHKDYKNSEEKEEGNFLNEPSTVIKDCLDSSELSPKKKQKRQLEQECQKLDSRKDFELGTEHDPVLYITPKKEKHGIESEDLADLNQTNISKSATKEKKRKHEKDSTFSLPQTQSIKLEFLPQPEVSVQPPDGEPTRKKKKHKKDSNEMVFDEIEYKPELFTKTKKKKHRSKSDSLADLDQNNISDNTPKKKKKHCDHYIDSEVLSPSEVSVQPTGSKRAKKRSEKDLNDTISERIEDDAEFSRKSKIGELKIKSEDLTDLDESNTSDNTPRKKKYHNHKKDGDNISTPHDKYVNSELPQSLVSAQSTDEEPVKRKRKRKHSNRIASEGVAEAETDAMTNIELHHSIDKSSKKKKRKKHDKHEQISSDFLQARESIDDRKKKSQSGLEEQSEEKPSEIWRISEDLQTASGVLAKTKKKHKDHEECVPSLHIDDEVVTETTALEQSRISEDLSTVEYRKQKRKSKKHKHSKSEQEGLFSPIKSENIVQENIQQEDLISKKLKNKHKSTQDFDDGDDTSKGKGRNGIVLDPIDDAGRLLCEKDKSDRSSKNKRKNAADARDVADPSADDNDAQKQKKISRDELFNFSHSSIFENSLSDSSVQSARQENCSPNETSTKIASRGAEKRKTKKNEKNICYNNMTFERDTAEDENKYGVGSMSVSEAEAILERIEIVELPVNFEVPPLHEHKLLKALGKQQKLDYAEKGILISDRRWTKQEKEILLGNWERIRPEMEIYDPSILLGCGITGCKPKKLLNYVRAKNLHVHLARGLNDKTLFSVYKQARNLFHPGRGTGKLTSAEVNDLKFHEEKHGKKWLLIAEALGKSPQSCETSFRAHQKGQETGPWSCEEEERLRKAVEDITAGNIEKVSSGKASAHWTSISKIVGTRNLFQCRQHWLDTMSWPKTGTEKPEWTKTATAVLIHLLYKNLVEDVALVDWSSLYARLKKYVPSYAALGHKWRYLKSTVPQVAKKTHKEIVTHMYHKILPVILKKKKLSPEDLEVLSKEH